MIYNYILKKKPSMYLVIKVKHMKVVFKISLRIEFQIYENNIPSITPKKCLIKIIQCRKGNIILVKFYYIASNIVV